MFILRFFLFCYMSSFIEMNLVQNVNRFFFYSLQSRNCIKKLLKFLRSSTFSWKKYWNLWEKSMLFVFYWSKKCVTYLTDHSVFYTNPQTFFSSWENIGETETDSCVKSVGRWTDYIMHCWIEFSKWVWFYRRIL